MFLEADVGPVVGQLDLRIWRQSVDPGQIDETIAPGSVELCS